MPSDRLFELEPVLTARQQFVIDELARSSEGLYADEVGALLHARKGKHPDWQRCEWCAKDGNGVLRALRQKRLVTRQGAWRITRSGRAMLTAPAGTQTPSVTPRGRPAYDPETAPIPF